MTSSIPLAIGRYPGETQRFDSTSHTPEEVSSYRKGVKYARLQQDLNPHNASDMGITRNRAGEYEVHTLRQSTGINRTEIERTGDVFTDEIHTRRINWTEYPRRYSMIDNEGVKTLGIVESTGRARTYTMRAPISAAIEAVRSLPTPVKWAAPIAAGVGAMAIFGEDSRS